MIKSIKDRIRKKAFRKRWRKINSHNLTMPDNIFDISKVYVGNNSYGRLNILSYDNPLEKLVIGNYCSIAKDVKFILGGDHYYDRLSNYPFGFLFEQDKTYGKTKGTISIEDGVWIGTSSIILSGVNIGKGSIIGAGSVVSRSIPPFAIAAGNPIKVIKYRFCKDWIERLIRIDYYSLIDYKFYKKYKTLLDKPLNEELIEKLEECFHVKYDKMINIKK